MSILPANVKVKKGQFVCELDPVRFKDRLANQKITTQSAEANFRNTSLTREVAEIAVVEYTEGIFKQDMKTVLDEIKMATSDLARVIDRVDWANRMYAKGYVTKAQATSEEIALQKAFTALEQAISKRSVLEKYTKNKTTKELKSEVEKARSDELARKATWERETAKTEHIERDIARCKMYAPADGELILAPGIEKGATVRERQLIFRVLTEALGETPR
jgi:HlyD family secretion protein